jgi:hypothetical protein
LELKDYELSKNLQDTNTPVEKFEFDDIHFWRYNNYLNSAETN